jgi:purine nucleoside permease
MHLRLILCSLALSLVFSGAAHAKRKKPPKPIAIKVVVVTMFEAGKDTGDRPGEFQHWVEQLPLPEVIAQPQGYRDLRYNPEKGVLGMVTGIGTARASASVMALGMDPRFDLSRAYWLVAGISGVDPEDMSLGSAAWAEWLVDGDIAHQIDIREAPGDWSTGYVPLRKSKPYELPRQEDDEGAVYRLNTGLVNWAYNLTRKIELPDTEDLQIIRAHYENHPTAQRPPFILKGDHLAAMTFWHGSMLTQWANDWVAYWTGGEGNFVTSAMEDTGTHQALNFLHNAGKVDKNRYLVLRSASNYSMPHPGLTAAQSLAGEKKDKGYSAYFPALENAYLVGSTVVNALVDGWDDYADKIPLSE